jgi:hypothetical protein
MEIYNADSFVECCNDLSYLHQNKDLIEGICYKGLYDGRTKQWFVGEILPSIKFTVSLYNNLAFKYCYEKENTNDIQKSINDYEVGDSPEIWPLRNDLRSFLVSIHKLSIHVRVFLTNCKWSKY